MHSNYKDHSDFVSKQKAEKVRNEMALDEQMIRNAQASLSAESQRKRDIRDKFRKE